jgi:hypothetical protein
LCRGSHRPRRAINNQLLIALQTDGTATFVAGFRSWLNLGYVVDRGQKAIRILAKHALSHLMQSRLVRSERPSGRCLHRRARW